MSTKWKCSSIFWQLFALLFVSVLSAQEEGKPTRFSHTGLKAAISTVSTEMISERNLNEGEGGALSLGYGFSQRFTLWATVLGSEHRSTIGDNEIMNFGGAELSLQHKFEIKSRFQPFGKVGVGVYVLEEDQTEESLIGTGITLSLGADYFFSRHFGIGAEFAWKKLDFFKRSIQEADGEHIIDVSPSLNGDTAAFLLTLTVQ